MGIGVSTLGAVVSFACALLLLRGYTRGRKRLLLWSSLCFFILGASNVLIFVDLVVFTDTDLYPLRLGTTLLAMILLLYGLIWESD